MAAATMTPTMIVPSKRPLPRRMLVLLVTGSSTIALLIGAPAWIVLHVASGTFYWTPIVLLVIGWLITGLGVTVGLHRLATHESFKTYRVVEVILYICAATAAQGMWQWIADHLTHHLHSDREGDPHSPNDGFWWAHWGWTIPYVSPYRAAYKKKLMRNPVLRWVGKLNALWVFGPFLALFLAFGWDGVLWGGFIRLGFVYHITWSVNSASHKWGSQPYPTGDDSRNNLAVGILGFGEGWHNNHHAFPWSARHGLEWWQIDLSYYLIWMLEKLHLAWGVRVPTKADKVARKLIPIINS